MRDRVLSGLDKYAVPLVTAGISGFVALIGIMLKFYSDNKAERAKQKDSDEQVDTDVRKQSMLSADAQLALLWKDKEQRDAVVLAQSARLESMTIQLADSQAQNRIKDWQIEQITRERDRLQAQLDELTRPRTPVRLEGSGG